MPNTVVVVLGPMAKQSGTSHTVAIRCAVEAIIRDHNLQGRLTVTAPEDLDGNTIPTEVFAAVDRAELVIADLSDLRPSVFYEIALTDALGLPILLLAAAGTTLPFYFTQQRVRFVDDFNDAAGVRAAVESAILNLVAGQTVGFVQNPISNFYGAPVVDISAAEGLASGYFFNFLGEVISATGGLLVTRNEVATISIVVPEPTSNAVQDWDTTTAIVARVTGQP